MPAGIISTVEGGFATVEFVNPALRGPKLQAVIDVGGPGIIETITRDGPRRKYRMPVGNAKLAGLLDVDAQGNPTAGPAIVSAGHDTGYAAATVAADPNDNPGSDNTDWHTPVAEYTSANAYVATTPNADVLHNRNQVFTGSGGSAGGSLQHPPTHQQIIDAVNDYEITNPKSVPGARQITPAAHVSAALATQTAALGSDPGSHGGEQPKGPGDLLAEPSDELPADPADPQSGDKTDSDPQPDDSWSRAALNEYAAENGVENADKLPNKGAVLAAIREAETAKDAE